MRTYFNGLFVVGGQYIILGSRMKPFENNKLNVAKNGAPSLKLDQPLFNLSALDELSPKSTIFYFV